MSHDILTMIPRSLLLLLAFSSLTLFTGQTAAAADDYHQWTSSKGTTIRAKFMRESGGKLTLLKEDGKQLVLRIDQLDAKSQKLAERLSSAPDDEPAETNADEITTDFRVPLFEEGPWKNYHAVYEGKNFFAGATKRGQVYIHMKKDGKRIPGKIPCVLRLTLHYHIDVGAQPKMLFIETDGEPAMNPKKLTFSGKNAVGTSFQVNYVFDDNGIEAYGFLRDRGGVEHPTRMHIGVRFPIHKKVTPQHTEAEITEIVGDSWIKADARTGDDLEFDYVTEIGFRKHPAMARGLNNATVKSEQCGPHLVKVTPPEREHGRLMLWNASTIAPHAGYSATLFRTETGDRSAKTSLRVDIE